MCRNRRKAGESGSATGGSDAMRNAGRPQHLLWRTVKTHAARTILAIALMAFACFPCTLAYAGEETLDVSDESIERALASYSSFWDVKSYDLPEGHDWYIEFSAYPGCTFNGEIQFRCLTCNAGIYKVIPARGHKWSEWETTQEATCTEEGSQTRTCSVCGATESQSIEPLGHDWGDWTVETEAAPGVEGSQVRTCSRCGAVDREIIAALPVDPNDDPSSNSDPTPSTSSVNAATSSSSAPVRTAGSGNAVVDAVAVPAESVQDPSESLVALSYDAPGIPSPVSAGGTADTLAPHQGVVIAVLVVDAAAIVAYVVVGRPLNAQAKWVRDRREKAIDNLSSRDADGNGKGASK